jgi:DNA invertase Pin-like site-specific DNA recombinase
MAGHAFGERHGRAKLREADARKVRALALGGVLSLAEIAAVFWISKATVWDLKTKRTWRHLWQNDALPATNNRVNEEN